MHCFFSTSTVVYTGIKIADSHNKSANWHRDNAHFMEILTVLVV